MFRKNGIFIINISRIEIIDIIYLEEEDFVKHHLFERSNVECLTTISWRGQLLCRVPGLFRRGWTCGRRRCESKGGGETAAASEVDQGEVDQRRFDGKPYFV